MLARRAAGVLLHPTALPGPWPSGDLGPSAYAFVDALARAGQSVWQMLPVGPPGYGDSPYSAESAFAGSPWLVDPSGLDVPPDATADAASPDAVDWAHAHRVRRRALDQAFDRFEADGGARDPDFRAFSAAEAGWLEDWALFTVLKRAGGDLPWTTWEEPLRRRDPAALDLARGRYARELERERFVQFAFAGQMASLRAHAEDRGVKLFGDLPIFVAHDSADVWQHQDLFRLDDAGNPTVVAGVPPDYFSRTGQRWGNPLYRWTRHAGTGFRWWTDRVASELRRFHLLRLDHFIGFQRYWEIPAGEATAMNGRWMKGPRDALFDALEAELGPLPFVAEDLGEVTPAVTRLRRRRGFPGLRILQFAFGTDRQAPSFLPHAHAPDAVVYTGTHDNDTTVGWFTDDGRDGARDPSAIEAERARALAYLGTSGHEVHWDMIRLAYQSVARLAVVPLQDTLGLGSSARTNRPGVAGGSFRFRTRAPALPEPVVARLRALAVTYGRGGAS